VSATVLYTYPSPSTDSSPGPMRDETAGTACTRGTGDTVAITLHVYGADLSNGTSVRRTYQQRPEDAAS
jgi:hypothetical protein